MKQFSLFSSGAAPPLPPTPHSPYQADLGLVGRSWVGFQGAPRGLSSLGPGCSESPCPHPQAPAALQLRPLFPLLGISSPGLWASRRHPGATPRPPLPTLVPALSAAGISPPHTLGTHLSPSPSPHLGGEQRCCSFSHDLFRLQLVPVHSPFFF